MGWESLRCTASVYVHTCVFAPLAVGTISAAAAAVSKYALPKLGYDVVCGISAHVISDYAFTATVACYSTAALAAGLGAVVGFVFLNFLLSRTEQ